MAVEFGVLIPTREAVMSGRPETAPLLAMAERAEAAGFDSVWIGDSLIARPRHEPLTLLAAVAGRTRRVRLGTGVLLPALRNPVVLAHVVVISIPTNRKWCAPAAVLIAGSVLGLTIFGMRPACPGPTRVPSEGRLDSAELWM